MALSAATSCVGAVNATAVRAAVKALLAIGQHLGAVARRKVLTGQLLDALVVRPGVGGKVVVHGARAGARKHAAGPQFQLQLRQGGHLGHDSPGAIAPAAQRIKDVIQGFAHVPFRFVRGHRHCRGPTWPLYSSTMSYCSILAI